MNRQITLSQYRSIDLTILGVILAITQTVIYLAATTVYADQLYVVSTVGAVTALVMMRWDAWAAVHATLGGLLYAALAGGDWQHYIIYGAGNLLSLAGLGLFRLLGKEKIRKDALLSMLFAFCVQLLMQLGRAGIAFLFGHEAAICLRFITTDALSILFTVCIIWVVRRIEGLFEDQKNYLLRTQSERQVEGREQF